MRGELPGLVHSIPQCEPQHSWRSTQPGVCFDFSQGTAAGISQSPIGNSEDPPSGQSGQKELDAATRLYLRYAKRLNALVERQCSAELARLVGVEDIVQSVFQSFFRRAGRGCYDVPDGDELWKLLLVIALHKVRDKAAYHHAAKRDAHLTIRGDHAFRCLESQAESGDSEQKFLKLVIDEALEKLPPRNRAMMELRIEGHEVSEIALRLKCSRRTVERILQETREKLGELLEKED